MPNSVTNDEFATNTGAARLARILIAACLGSFLSISTLVIYPFAIFASGIAAELGITKLEATRLIGPPLLLTIVMQPIVGWAVDRWPRRNVALASMGFLACAMALMGLSPPSAAGVSIALAAAIILSAFTGPGVFNAYLSQNFDRRRGLALGVTAAFSGVGFSLTPPLASYLVGEFGWRPAYGAFAAVAGTGLLINAMLLPVEKATAERRSVVGSKGVLGRVGRMPIFWVIALLFFIVPIIANAVPLYLPLLLEARGASSSTAAVSLTALGATMIVSRPVLGWLIDRWPAWSIAAIVILGPLIGTIVLIFSTGVFAAFFAAACFGAGIGGEFLTLAYLVSRTFGVRHFGYIYGWLSVAVASGVSLGPIVVGALSSNSNYTVALYVMTICGCIGLGLVLVLRHLQLRNDLTVIE